MKIPTQMLLGLNTIIDCIDSNYIGQLAGRFIFDSRIAN